MRYLLAHDIGTSGDKATLFTEDGRAAAACIEHYPLYQENPLYAEQDAEDWWNAFRESTRKLLAISGVNPAEIAAVSFSGQMMGCLPVNREEKPLRRALIWADQRAQEQVEKLREQMDDAAFYRIAGHRNSPSYSVQKAMWIRDNEPRIYQETRAFLNAKDWIVLKLTGSFLTDPSDANGTGAMDLDSLSWSRIVLDAAGIDPGKMPEIVPSPSFVGTVRKSAAKETGLSPETKVIMGAGDGVAANVGAGSVAPGSAYICLGTSAWAASTAEAPYYDPLRRSVTWAHAVPGLYSPNATMQYCCGAYDWFRNTVLRDEIRQADESGKNVHNLVSEIASKAPAGSGGLIFLPHLLGERAPRWNPNVRGAYIGLSGKTTREELVRSVFEGISYHLALCFDAINRNGALREVTLIGGGAKNDFWAQLLADVLGIPAVIPEETGDANSMGAAVIAGVGAGIFPDFSAVRHFLHPKKRFEPRPELTALYRDERERFEASYKAVESLYPA